MNNKDRIKFFQEELSKSIDIVYDTGYYPQILKPLSIQDKDLIKHLDKLEYKKFDEDWIVKIESFFPSLNQIISNIRNTLKYEEEILPVERTRRTSNESVRHILRNTKYIKDINEDDEVYPSKVLNTVSEIDYGIYENRLIMTLIDRLYHYLLKRIEAIHTHIHGYKQTKFNLENEFKLGNSVYTLNFQLNAKETFDSGEVDLHNKRILERTEAAFKVVSRMFHSDFMRIMSRYKKVVPPILKTQMIQKNADFRNAYTLWLYLDRLNVLDFTLQLQESSKALDDSSIDDIDKGLMALFTSVFVHSDMGISLLDSKDVSFQSLTPLKSDAETYIERINVTIPEMVLEANLATEYHLEKAKQLMSRKELANLVIDNKPENTNYLKQVLLDQYSIADQIFNAYLKLNQDDDVFSQLLTYKHPVKKYEEALNRYLMTKAARQVKEKLFTEAVILEDKWIKLLTELQEEAIESIIKSGEKHDETIIQNMQKEVNKTLKTLEKAETEKTKKTLQDQRIKNNKSVKDIQEKYQAEIKTYREIQNKRMKAEKEKIALKLLQEKQRIKEREAQKRKLEREKQIKEKQLKLKKLKEAQQKLKQNIKSNVTKTLTDYKNKK